MTNDHAGTSLFDRTHSYDTRNRNDLLPDRARLTITQNSISVAGPNIWNSIPENIKTSLTRGSFKSQYKNCLLSYYNS